MYTPYISICTEKKTTKPKQTKPNRVKCQYRFILWLQWLKLQSTLCPIIYVYLNLIKLRLNKIQMNRSEYKCNVSFSLKLKSRQSIFSIKMFQIRYIFTHTFWKMFAIIRCNIFCQMHEKNTRTIGSFSENKSPVILFVKFVRCIIIPCESNKPLFVR